MERKQILEYFEAYKEETQDRIAAGIEQNRKGYGYITVTDADGRPVPDARVHLTQKTHEFKYGANLFMLDELETPEKNEKYKEYFKQAFNMATLPFYWDDLEPERGAARYAKDSKKIYRRPAPDLCLEFCEENGIEPREHGLAYDHFFPEWLWDAPLCVVKREFERRCKEISERYADRIKTIEVTNETWWDEGRTVLYEEPDFVEWCFQMANKYFGANQLVINEASGVWADQSRASDKYYSQIERALIKGAPIDAIGIQYHMFYRAEDEYKETRPFYNPLKLFKVLDNYARLGKPIQITEITVPAYTESEEDEALQAKIIEYLYSIWFSHKNVEQIIYWNLVDGYAAWAPQGDMTAGENYYRGGLLRFDFTPKPAYYTIKKLFSETWRTQTEITTDTNGRALLKGFYGGYEATVTAKGAEYKEQIQLKKNGRNEIKIVLP